VLTGEGAAAIILSSPDQAIVGPPPPGYGYAKAQLSCRARQDDCIAPMMRKPNGARLHVRRRAAAFGRTGLLVRHETARRLVTGIPLWIGRS